MYEEDAFLPVAGTGALAITGVASGSWLLTAVAVVVLGLGLVIASRIIRKPRIKNEP